MLFALGFIIGFLAAMLIVIALVYFRTQAEGFAKRIQTKIEQSGPRPKGQIYIPEDDGKIARDEIIKKNKEMGKDTPISELQ